MKGIYALLMAGTLASCSPYAMQGNPAAIQTGASIGGILGAIIGDRAGGDSASQFGALLGTMAGAVVGNAMTAPRRKHAEEEGYRIDSRHTEPTSEFIPIVSDLQISGMRFIDDNRNHIIESGEKAKLVFDVTNEGSVPVYNVTPIIKETSGIRYLFVSEPVQIACLPAGNSVRYIATLVAGKKLKTGQADFCVYAIDDNGAVSEMHEFSLPTQKRK